MKKLLFPVFALLYGSQKALAAVNGGTTCAGCTVLFGLFE
jgi:hypothetical protein